MDPLEIISELSREYGTPEFVKGGGGNTSVKDADSLWVKPSGIPLCDLRPDRVVVLDRARLGALYAWRPPEDPIAREAEVQELMYKAVRPGETGRPSVEAPLHDSLPGRYVVHTHPTVVNGMTCALDGQRAAGRLFPEAEWVPYVDPGYTLSMAMRERIQRHRAAGGEVPGMFLLENHGIFIHAATSEGIRQAYTHVMDTVGAEYEAAGISAEIPTGPPPDPDTVRRVHDRLQDWLGTDAMAIAASGSFAVPMGPLSPDHIVYSLSLPCVGPFEEANVKAYVREHGVSPRVVVTEDGVFGIGPQQRTADRALEFARDGAQIERLAPAFGGIRYLNESQRRFIETWEVEAYRRTVSG